MAVIVPGNTCITVYCYRCIATICLHLWFRYVIQCIVLLDSLTQGTHKTSYIVMNAM